MGVDTVRAAAFLAFWSSSAGWSWYHYLYWCGFFVVALEVVAQLALGFGWTWSKLFMKGKEIKKRGTHLDKLTTKDFYFIAFGKVGVSVLTFHMLYYCYHSPRVIWSTAGMNVAQAVLAVPLLFVVYDFFYTLFHRFLHVRMIYGYVHKHHHRQHAPSRGNLDAINVHPFELIVGEYLHLLAIVLVAEFAFPVHAYSVLTFVLFGGFMASLNHTRYDVRFPILEFVYQVRYHDIHHWDPRANFGQYIMLWDRLFGWFMEYPADGAKVAVSKEE